MKSATRRRTEPEIGVIRVFGRGLRSQRGVHLSLRSLREAAGKTQEEVSAVSGIDQADISRLEARERLDESLVSTLQRYLAAIGAELELTAVFGGKRIVVARASDTPVGGKPANKPVPRPGRKAARR